MGKIPSGARFIIAGKKCIDKQLSKHVTSAFKLLQPKKCTSRKKILKSTKEKNAKK